jgi:cell division initiation protein
VTDEPGQSVEAESISLPLRRALRGYSRESVDAVVNELTRRLASAEQRVVEAEGQNAALVSERGRLLAEIDRFREIERSLTQTLSLAEESARATEQRAAEEAEQMLARARSEAEALVREAATDRQRVFTEIDAIRAQLARALAQLAPPEETVSPPSPPFGPAAPPASPPEPSGPPDPEPGPPAA